MACQHFIIKQGTRGAKALAQRPAETFDLFEVKPISVSSV
ncbi:hypothetical protein STZ1_20905 [Bacillus subtilis]